MIYRIELESNQHKGYKRHFTVINRTTTKTITDILFNKFKRYGFVHEDNSFGFTVSNEDGLVKYVGGSNKFDILENFKVKVIIEKGD